MSFNSSAFSAATDSYLQGKFNALPSMPLPTNSGVTARPGFNVLVGRNGSIVYEKSFGYANLEQGALWSTDTVSGIRSLTKEITAAAMLKAMNQEWIKIWNESINLGISNQFDLPIANANLFPTIHAAYQNTTWPNTQNTTFDLTTTIGQVLSHTSGASLGWGHQERPKLARGSELDIIEAFFEFAYCGTPGVVADYGDQTPWLIGAAIYDLTGQHWYDYVADIFSNAGMTNSYPTLGQSTYVPSLHGPLGPGVVGHVANPYIWDSSRNSYVNAPYAHPDWGWCIGGTYSTARDMYEYYKDLTTYQIVNANLLNTMDQAQTGFADNPGNEWIHPIRRDPNYPLPSPMGTNHIGGPYDNDPNSPNFYQTKGTNLANWGYGTTIGVPINGNELICLPGGFFGMFAGSVRFLDHDTYIVVLSNSIGGGNTAYEIAEIYEQNGGLT